ncbi:MAG: FAD-dependent thymidylate synthase, partial [Chloroflexi bacterium]|nr:FAD-dependent thymidylate synthase [Chloroflexota bacterium]
NIYTKWLWSQNLWNMMHFLKLRMHEHAQYESRQYALAVHTLLSEHLPKLMGFFDKHIMGED